MGPQFSGDVERATACAGLTPGQEVSGARVGFRSVIVLSVGKGESI